jgi:hypothetical protein
MKTKFFVLLGLFFILTQLSNAQPNSPCVNGTRSYPIYRSGAQLVEKFDAEGAEIVRIEYDLIFTSKESFRNLSPEWEYLIIGFADTGVKDLDVKVYEYDDLLDKWTLVVQDDATDAFAMVAVTPTRAAMYKVEVIAYEFYEGYSAARYGLMFVHD